MGDWNAQGQWLNNVHLQEQQVFDEAGFASPTEVGEEESFWMCGVKKSDLQKNSPGAEGLNITTEWPQQTNIYLAASCCFEPDKEKA